MIEQQTYTAIPSKAVVANSNSSMSLSVLIDKETEQLAISLAKALKDKEIRKIIKDEAMLQFDGDYDVLYTTLQDKKINKGINIDDLLFENYQNQTKGTRSSFEKTKENIKDLQFSVPVNCEKWNIEEQMPLVTYIPKNFNEKTTKYVRAFDSEGKVYLLSTQEEPEVPVVVIGSCERMEKEINLKTEEKQNKATFYINCSKLQFPELSNIETWIQGGPEIRIGMKTNDGQVDLLKVYYFDRKDVKDNKWFYYTASFYRWDFTDLESTGFGVTEIDDGSPYEFSFGFTFTPYTGISFPFTIKYTGKANDDYLGSDQLYTDYLWKQIDCGSQFKMYIKY